MNFESACSNVALWHKQSMLMLIRMLCFNSLIILRLIGLVLHIGNIRQCETIYIYNIYSTFTKRIYFYFIFIYIHIDNTFWVSDVLKKHALIVKSRVVGNSPLDDDKKSYQR